MKTLYLRIIVIFTAALVCSLVVLLGLSARTTRQMTGDFFEGSMTLELRRARSAYETGGQPALAAFLTETDEALKGRRYLTDATGRDLVSGADRSALLPGDSNGLGFPRKIDGQIVIVRASSDGKYRLLVMAPPPVSPMHFAPYFLLVGLAIVFLGWALSAGIIAPLRRLATAVESFGRGDLSARVRSERKDEIGNLARSFNGMADRIETLLTAERRLLQDVSHELRSPLARLSFAAELMKDTSNPEASLARVRREINRISGLVATLLQVTGAEGDPSARRSARLSLNALVDDIISDCRLETEARQVRIEGPVRAPAVEVEGDDELLRRAVENVLRNAIRFAPAGTTVAAELESSGSNAILRVRDSGPGVPEDLLARIFDPFFKVDESRDGGSGAGLGLSIARRAVLLHGGEIKAENMRPGLRVTLVIPAIPIPDQNRMESPAGCRA